MIQLMPDELLVILTAEIVLLAAVAAMTFWRRRTDVLSGRYFSGRVHQPPPFVARPRLPLTDKRGTWLRVRPVAEASARSVMRLMTQA